MNNLPVRERERPVSIAERMIKLVKKIHHKPNSALINMCIILPRSENSFKIAGSDEERIDFWNGKATSTKVMYRQYCVKGTKIYHKGRKDSSSCALFLILQRQ
ncbi:uncharacterized protein LOC120351468 [Nilaparvata lugens]|uniref:uncharacterized protein LOC120351468 n=1 Tax=Nilaparvata lugens TaxID=108931 RepID=UPI00193CF4E9|nr:uncharacterized protein LOC120351468 [Nilaparvata lugens]XP_039284923.1 uncharacterized protein LOC120351468 [Nilaparvata lugens]